MKRIRHALPTIVLGLLMVAPAFAVQVGDLVRIKGAEESKMIGMGLVVGLRGTGDGDDYRSTMDMLAKMISHLARDGTTADDLEDTKNVAIVSLSATIPATGVREGDKVDVYVSAIGASKSLDGGRLVLMPMKGPQPDSGIFAYAEGAVMLNSPTIPTSGVIRAGAQIVRDDIRANFIQNGRLTLVLSSPTASFQMASTIAAQINGSIDPDGPQIARALDQKNVEVEIPVADQAEPTQFIAEVLSLSIDPDFIETGARVYINEKSGTIVMSGNVQVSPVAISHKGLTITMITPQPEPTIQRPLVEDQTVVGLDPERRGGAQLADLIAAFNQLKVDVKDRVEIIKLIHSMGRLHAELVFEQ